tara:strand:+ start:4316 stop:5215 length:900 start_codon:yes stop_codon:yes gene_type:complete
MNLSDFRKKASSAMKKVAGKKDEKKKPQKAMDAGARLRRKVERRVHAKYVSGSEDLVPDSIRDHYEIDESSLSRIKSKSDKGGMAVISASRGDKSSKENKARAKQLDRDIKGKGLPGATKVQGRWDEKDDKTGEVTKVKERSHVVTSGKKGKRKFKKAVKELGKKYGQDAVLTQTKKTGTVSATRKGGLGKDSGGKNVKRFTAGTMKPGRTGENDTKIKKKTFTYESYLRLQERGKTYVIFVNWRGRTIKTQMFFGKFSRPTKAEVRAEIEKVYPRGMVLYYNPVRRDPTEPLLYAGQK